MPRQARIDYPGALHHVIVRGIEGRYIFKEDYDKNDLLTRLKKLLEKSSLQIYAWSIMSNHFHLAIQTGQTTLSEFMRQLLTGYAINYNKRHKRKGYLFQNRYKSILCDADEYLLPLIRYVHLNPVKAKMVRFDQLRKYKWTGHVELMEGKKKVLIEQDEILGFFGETEGQAKTEYKKFVEAGLNSKENFMSGGLIQSVDKIKGILMSGEMQMSDERILGDGNFVNDVLERMGEIDKEKKHFKNLGDLLNKLSQYYKVEPQDILKTKTMRVREARMALVYYANKYLDISATSAGKTLGISQAAASMLRKKGRGRFKENDLVEKLLKLP